MKTKLYRKWLKCACDEFNGSQLHKFANGDYGNFWSVGYRMINWKNLIGTSYDAKKRKAMHVLAWCMMADHSKKWSDFKTRYKKHSKAYWTSESMLRRVIATGSAR